VNTFSTWLTWFMLALFVTMVAVASQYPPGARFMPFVVGIPGIALCALQLLLDALRTRGSRVAGYRFRAAPKAGKPAEMAAAEDEFGPHTVASEAMMFGYFVGFIAGVLLFGFYVSVPVMLVTFLRRQADAGWKLALALGGGATLAMYLMFGVLLHIQLHPGFVTRSVLSALGV
jgi:hypothetical protein